jgi:hypothetical protein
MNLVPLLYSTDKWSGRWKYCGSIAEEVRSRTHREYHRRTCRGRCWRAVTEYADLRRGGGDSGNCSGGRIGAGPLFDSIERGRRRNWRRNRFLPTNLGAKIAL